MEAVHEGLAAQSQLESDNTPAPLQPKPVARVVDARRGPVPPLAGKQFGGSVEGAYVSAAARAAGVQRGTPFRVDKLADHKGRAQPFLPARKKGHQYGSRPKVPYGLGSTASHRTHIAEGFGSKSAPGVAAAASDHGSDSGDKEYTAAAAQAAIYMHISVSVLH